MAGLQGVPGTVTPRYEVADVFRQYGQAYRRKHRLSAEQWEAMRAIEQCRTAALGGHVDECDTCGALRISYNSCRNRHCPKCGALEKARWLEARQAELLPVEYFHIVFTTDHALNPLVRWNQTAIYNLLFRSASEALKGCGAKYLGGQLGFVAVLHTWGQALSPHIHLHCIVTGGALSFDGQAWRSCPQGFLFPVVELSQVFRDKFCGGLARLYRRGELVLGGACAELEREENFDRWLSEMQTKKWQVYAKEVLGGPEQVFDYLGRYVHRVAISNHRILGIEEGRVRFQWRDNRNGGELKEMSLDAEEFIRRFLLHVLPKGFVRIRYFGLLSNRDRRAKLRRCRELLGLDAELATVEEESFEALLERLTGIDVYQCPVCGVGRMVRQRELDPVPEASGWAVRWPDRAVPLVEAA